MPIEENPSQGTLKMFEAFQSQTHVQTGNPAVPGSINAEGSSTDPEASQSSKLTSEPSADASTELSAPTARSEKPTNEYIVLGVCCMQKKYKSLTQLLDLLSASGDFKVVCFQQETILEKPVKEWPVVQVLITFHSTGFPLEKSQEYVTLRQPFCINSPHMQSTLLDRRRVYATLEACGVPTPNYTIFHHGEEDPASLVVHEEYIEAARSFDASLSV